MTDRIANPWGERTPFGRDEEWPVRVDQFLQAGVSEEDVDRWVQTPSISTSRAAASSGCAAGAWIASTMDAWTPKTSSAGRPTTQKSA